MLASKIVEPRRYSLLSSPGQRYLQMEQRPDIECLRSEQLELL
jgi:hypothetical protein